ncbi:MAG TPA: hypothetical protein VIA18_16800 [Polyangia bacterium]|jgi:tetratricopeptide (TPR) repeat protein|nr:hypothetical protein [Polyangia bacterium]
MRTVLFSLVLATVASFAADAHAQDFEAAGKHFSAAQEAFGARKFKTAASEFEAAYAISKDPVLLFNIGESYEKAGDGVKAIASYRQYLKDQPQAADKPDVQKRIRAIEAKHMRLVDQSAPDDKPAAATPATTSAPVIAATPAAPATPSPAAPQVTPAAPATAAGTAPASETPPGSVAPKPARMTPPSAIPESTTPATSALPPSTVAPATTPTPERASEHAPEPAKTAEPAPVPPPAPGLIDEGPPSHLRVAAWIGVASTLALLTAGAVFGLAAQSRADEITRQLSYVSTSGQPNQFTAATNSTLNQLKSDGNLYNGLGIAFFSASAASAVATVVLFVVDAKRPPAKEKAHALRFAPAVGANSAGLSLQGSF